MYSITNIHKLAECLTQLEYSPGTEAFMQTHVFEHEMKLGFITGILRQHKIKVNA